MMYVCMYDIYYTANIQKEIQYWTMSFGKSKVKVSWAFVNTYGELKITTKAMLAIVIW